MKLSIEGTPVSPQVLLDTEERKFVISGRSLPENATKFYKELVNWLKEHVENRGIEAHFDFVMDYYNTGSYIGIMTVLNTLEKLNELGCKFTVRWYYEQDDEDALDDGRSFQDTTKVPFKTVEM